MKRLMTMGIIALSLHVNSGAVVYGGRQNLSGVPTPQVQQRVNPSLHHGGIFRELPAENQQGAMPQEITFINKTNKTVVAFVKRNNEEITGLLIPIEAHQTRSVALPEFYWLAPVTVGGLMMPGRTQAEVSHKLALHHGFATIAEIGAENQAAKTSIELNENSNNITIESGENNAIIVK